MQKDTRIESHTIVVTVDNEPGVLARVIGLFAGRGYNIESLTVAEIDKATHTSRITVVTSGTPAASTQPMPSGTGRPCTAGAVAYSA